MKLRRLLVLSYLSFPSCPYCDMLVSFAEESLEDPRYGR